MLTEHDIATTGQVVGLSSGEASRRLASSGPNTLPDRPMPAWRRLAKRFWGPLPWMLEGTAILTLLLGREMGGGHHHGAADRELADRLPAVRKGGPGTGCARDPPAPAGTGVP